MKSFLFISGAMMAATLSASPATTVSFSSEEALCQAAAPFTPQELVSRLSEGRGDCPIAFQVADLDRSSRIIFRNPGIGNVCQDLLFKGHSLSVFYPQSPRVPHHISLAFHRDVQGLADLSEEENSELFATVRRIAEIYKTISITGFVIALYDATQLGHQGRMVVEIIPHLPGFNGEKNIVDKVDCNRYVLFRSANISTVFYRFKTSGHVDFWKNAFLEEQRPLSEKDWKIDFPYTRKESYGEQATGIVRKHLFEILKDRGGIPSKELAFDLRMPLILSEEPESATSQECPFCKPEIVDRQKIFETENAALFYNIRKESKPGLNFLILPKRHIEKVYGLSSAEMREIAEIRRAVVEVLREMHPGFKVTVYIQDDPSVGQTVFHSHEQVVALEPENAALSWCVTSLSPDRADQSEIDKVKLLFKSMLEAKVREEEKKAS